MAEILATCPYIKCNKIIFRKATTIIKTNDPEILSFETRCPHCKNSVRIRVGVNIKTEPIWD